MNSTIGSKYQKYYKLDSSSTFEFKQKRNQINTIPVYSSKKKTGTFESADFLYRLEYPGLIIFSSKLEISIYKNGYVYLNTEEIPDFILKNRDFEYLSLSRIKMIGDSLLRKQGIRIEYSLYHDDGNKQFVWEINNIIRDHTEHGFMDGLIECIKLEPTTGHLIYQGILETGHIF